MNPIPEPDELLEAECNAHGLYGLPEPLLAERSAAQASEPMQPMRAALASAPKTE